MSVVKSHKRRSKSGRVSIVRTYLNKKNKSKFSENLLNKMSKEKALIKKYKWLNTALPYQERQDLLDAYNEKIDAKLKIVEKQFESKKRYQEKLFKAAIKKDKISKFLRGKGNKPFNSLPVEVQEKFLKIKNRFEKPVSKLSGKIYDLRRQKGSHLWAPPDFVSY